MNKVFRLFVTEIKCACALLFQVTPRLTHEQLQALLEQCREEQRALSSSALSEVRHSVTYTDASLAVEDYDSGAEMDHSFREEVNVMAEPDGSSVHVL